MRVVLATGRGDFGDAEGDVITGVENVVGTAFNDALYGSAVANTLSGLGGGDSIHGLEGNDALLGGDGDDALEGGAGADRLDGGAGFDTIDYLDSSGVTIDLGTGLCRGGEAQGDVISASTRVDGSSLGGDLLTGSAASNVLSGWGGSDNLTGLGGDDRLNGAAAAATSCAAAPGGYARRRRRHRPHQLLRRRRLGLGEPAVRLRQRRRGRWRHLFGDRERQRRQEVATPSSAMSAPTASPASRETIIWNGYDGNDILQGGEGHDVLEGGIGADRLDGGAGIDGLDYYTSGSGVTIDLTAGLAAGGDAQGDVFSGIEDVEGTLSHGDSLAGPPAPIG